MMVKKMADDGKPMTDAGKMKIFFRDIDLKDTMTVLCYQNIYFISYI